MKRSHILLIALLTAATGFLAGYGYRGHLVKTNPIVRVDTIRDTLRDTVPRFISEIEIEEVEIPVYDLITLKGDTVRDTAYVSIPLTQREYRTADYRAWVSGYRPRLDSLYVYPKTIIQTRHEEPRRWGIGIIAGYGVGKNGLSPYVGIGGFWRVW